MSGRAAPPRWRDSFLLARADLRREPRFVARVALLLALGTGGIAGLAALTNVRSLWPLRLSLPFGAAEFAGNVWGEPWPGGAVPAVQPLTDHLHELLTALAVAVVLTFLAGCLSVWVLLRARNRGRLDELGVRAAMGASRRQIVRQRLAEGVLLAIPGLGGGLLVGAVFRWALASTLPAGIAGSLSGWGPEVAVACVLAAGVTLAAALPRGLRGNPRRGGSGPSPAVMLRSGAGNSSDLLVGTLFALCVPLLCGSVLAARSMTPQRTDAGVAEARDSLLLRVRIPAAVRDRTDSTARLQSLLDGVRDARGVTDAGLSTPGAWAGLGPGYRIVAECRCSRGGMSVPFVSRWVSHAAAEPGFFQVMGWTPPRGEAAPAARGDAARRADRGPDGGRGVWVNRAFERSVLFGAEAGDRSVQVLGAGPGAPWRRIRGVLASRPAGGLGTQRAAPLVVMPLRDRPPRELDLWVRGPASPSRLGRVARRAARNAVPAAQVEIRGTLGDQVRRIVRPVTWLGRILGAAGLLAVIVAVTGVGAGTRDEMQRRRGEMGLRRAVGARGRDILVLVLRWAARISGAGIAAGLVLGVPMAAALQLLLPGVSVTDGMAWVGVLTVLAAAAFSGAWAPARRAARRSPMDSLRLW